MTTVRVLLPDDEWAEIDYERAFDQWDRQGRPTEGVTHLDIAASIMRAVDRWSIGASVDQEAILTLAAERPTVLNDLGQWLALVGFAELGAQNRWREAKDQIAAAADEEAERLSVVVRYQTDLEVGRGESDPFSQAWAAHVIAKRVLDLLGATPSAS